MAVGVETAGQSHKKLTTQQIEEDKMRKHPLPSVLAIYSYFAEAEREFISVRTK